MSDNISFLVQENCYAITWSYGEICLNCNCCGRKEKGLSMWQARLNYHIEELKREVNFIDWDCEYPEVVKIQKEINKENIKYNKRKIKYYERKINNFQNNFLSL